MSSNVYDRMTGIIADKLNTDKSSIQPGSRLADDLGADSLDAVEIIMALEDEFEVEILDSEVEYATIVADYALLLCKKTFLDPKVEVPECVDAVNNKGVERPRADVEASEDKPVKAEAPKNEADQAHNIRKDTMAKEMVETKHDLLTTKYTKVLEEKEFQFNAPHLFEVVAKETDEVLASVHFQEGPIKENGVNGLCNEDLIVMVIRRLEGFQQSQYACRDNAVAITKLEEALLWLRKRTMAREARGVEGTSAV